MVNVQNNQSFTYSFWLSAESLIAVNCCGSQGRVILDRFPLTNHISLYISENDSTLFWQIRYDDLSIQNRNTTLKVVVGQWYNVMIVRDILNNSFKLIVDGNVIDQYNDIGQNYSQPGLMFGKHGDNHSYFNGKLDDIGIWNRALTQNEITNLYNGNATNLEPITDKNQFYIHPNPARDHITVNYGNFALMSGYQLRITNSLGQQMFQSNINQQSDYLDLSSWTGNGIYFVHIIDPAGNTVDIKKIVLQ